MIAALKNKKQSRKKCFLDFVQDLQTRTESNVHENDGKYTNEFKKYHIGTTRV